LRKLINALFKKGHKQVVRLPKHDRESQPVKRTLPLPHFKSELELKTFLANNLDYVEPGLKLFVRGSWRGVEVPCAFSEWSKPGQIDILAEDRNGDLVVIELKPDGRPVAFGQVLGYLAWMKTWATTQDIGGRTRPARKVRGAIVVRRATPMLLYLVKSYPEFPITIYEIDRNISLESVEAARA
jgi:RecB family endonuclease NucS